MVDLIGKLQAIIKLPRGDVSNTDWLDGLPRSDYLTAQEIVLERLRDFVSGDNPLDLRALHALFVIDEHCRKNVAVLTRQYVSAPVLAYEIDERIWQSVHNHYHALEMAYQAFLDRYADHLAQSPLASDFPQLLLNIVDCQRCAAKWRYLRYQSMAEGGWLKLHRFYLLAESLGCARTPLRRYKDQAETTVMSCYLQALMLDSLNHTSMLKVEIDMLAGWLAGWCGALSLEASYLEARHLFFVGTEEDRGGRRIRHLQPAKSCRYWDTDNLVLHVARLQQHLNQGRVPDDLRLAPSISFSDGLLLVDHMLAEWSRTHYRRQRRSDERDEVTKVAHVVNGILNVCQHVKNVVYSRGKAFHYDELNARPLPDAAEAALATEEGGIALSGGNPEKWTIENESKYGFGAVANAEMNLWLRPGRLIALDYEMNPDMPVVGVVRSVTQRPGHKRYVGIEVLCHTPAYVRMKNLFPSAEPQDFLPTDLFLASTLTTQGLTPFPALYLPRNEDRDIPSSLLLPRVEFIAGGVFELRTERHHCQARLGRVIEEKDDWVRVEVQWPRQSIPST